MDINLSFILHCFICIEKQNIWMCWVKKDSLLELHCNTWDQSNRIMYVKSHFIYVMHVWNSDGVEHLKLELYRHQRLLVCRNGFEVRLMMFHCLPDLKYHVDIVYIKIL